MMALEAVIYLVYGEKQTWEQISSTMMKENFIRDILKFNIKDVP
jgi:hypothetical protein